MESDKSNDLADDEKIQVILESYRSASLSPNQTLMSALTRKNIWPSELKCNPLRTL